MQTLPSFRQERTWRRGHDLALAALVCPGRHTVTGMLCTNGKQFEDWTSSYRLFSKSRFDGEGLFTPVLKRVTQLGEEQAPVVSVMDDSLLRRGGRKTHGVAWRRDPMGPPFQVNFVRGQRILQLSAALIDKISPAPATLVPVDWVHAPTPARPPCKASEQEWEDYHRAQRACNINRCGAERLQSLRGRLDEMGKAARPLWTATDARFTNKTVLRNLPDRCVLIGRVRKNTRLYQPVEASEVPRLGRPQCYGERAPTPEQWRQDSHVPWKEIEVWAAGQVRTFKVKTMDKVLWQTAGADRPVRLIVIAPLGYRLTQKSKVLYRDPAYLICTDPDIPLDQVVQVYVWRGDIELNFRDEKTLLGVGEAHIRTPRAVEKVPQLIVSAYSLLRIAASQVYGNATHDPQLPPPKWRAHQKPTRLSTRNLLAILRYKLWASAIADSHFSDFLTPPSAHRTPRNTSPSLASASFYAVGRT